MLDIDGNVVDDNEIAAVTKISTNKSSYTSVSVKFDVVLKGGYVITVSRTARADSSGEQDQQAEILIEQLRPIRERVLYHFN